MNLKSSSFLGALSLFSSPLFAQSVSSPFDTTYSISSLGAPSTIPPEIAVMAFKAGDPDTILVGGHGNDPAGAIYSLSVVRGAGGHITGFSGTPTFVSTAPNIDGGLDYGPGGVLFYTDTSGGIGEIKPGSTSPDKVVFPPAFAQGGGSLIFTPAGVPGAGNLALMPYTGVNGGNFQTGVLSPDGLGTYNISVSDSGLHLVAQGEGVGYVIGGSPHIPGTSLLAIDYGPSSALALFALDSSGLPILASKQTMVTGITDAQGFAIDPLTGDRLIAGLHTDELFELQGFSTSVPEPAEYAVVFAALAFGLGFIRRARNSHAG